MHSYARYPNEFLAIHCHLAQRTFSDCIYEHIYTISVINSLDSQLNEVLFSQKNKSFYKLQITIREYPKAPLHYSNSTAIVNVKEFKEKTAKEEEFMLDRSTWAPMHSNAGIKAIYILVTSAVKEEEGREKTGSINTSHVFHWTC